MKLIISNTLTGLGNRLENIVSLYRLSKIYKCNFGLFWHNNDWVGRSFKELFSNFHEHVLHQLPILTDRNSYANCLIFNPGKTISDHKHRLEHNSIIVVNSDDSVFIDETENSYYLYNWAHLIKPSNKVICYSNQVLLNHNLEDVPAIHIRVGVGGRTEQKDLNLRNPPTIEEYDVYIDNNFSDIFFLATDSPELKIRYQNKYKDRAIVLPTTLDYKDNYFCIHSLAEMYIMSRCKEVVGSESSFNRFAALWGRKKRVILHSNQEPRIFLPEDYLDFQ